MFDHVMTAYHVRKRGLGVSPRGVQSGHDPRVT